MNIKQSFTWKVVTGLVGAAVLIGAFFLFNNFIYQEKQGEQTPQEPYRATLEGEYVCLLLAENANPAMQDAGCEPGIKTDVGEYYAVNQFLMSQMHEPLEVGQRFSANGVMTSHETSEPEKWQQYQLMGIFSITDSLNVLDQDDTSSVGITPTRVTSSLGDNATFRNLTISPKEVVSDSRCPADVVCVWAGTVEVRTTLATEVSHGEHVLMLGEPQAFGAYTVTLVEVAPIKNEDAIPASSYTLTYLVSSK